METKQHKFVYESYKTPLWIFTIFLYCGVMVLSIISIGLNVNALLHTSNSANINILILITLLSVILLITTFFWLIYNTSANSKSLKHLKIKSKWLNQILIWIIFLFYVFSIYLTVLFFTLHLSVIEDTPSFSWAIWFNLVVIIISICAYLFNNDYCQSQNSVKDYKNGTFFINWWPNLIYSYWLDKLQFSKFIFNLSQDQYVVCSSNKLKSIPFATSSYDIFLTQLNHSKRSLQKMYSILMTFWIAAVVMSLASIIVWIVQSHNNLEMDIFMLLFWLGLSAISIIYLWFININNFQIIMSDDESTLINKYDFITFDFKNIPTSQHIQLIGLARKILLYYGLIDNEQEFKIQVDEDIVYSYYFKTNKSDLSILISQKSL